MMPVAIYGWKCTRKDKEVLLKRIGGYLARHGQTLAKTVDRKMFDAYLPFTIRCFYWNLNPALGTWFDVYPNEDAKGQFFFPDHKECGWLLHVRINLDRHANIIPDEAETFIRELLDSTAFEHRVIQESGDLHEGLQRGHLP